MREVFLFHCLDILISLLLLLHIYVYLYENVYLFKLSYDEKAVEIFTSVPYFLFYLILKQRLDLREMPEGFFFFFFNNLQYFPELFPPLAGSGGSFRGGLCEISGFVGFTSLTPAVFELLMAGGLTRPQRKHKVRVHLVFLTVWS